MTKRVLVVEDNELNLKLFCDLLRAHGFQTEPVRDGRDAYGRARAFQESFGGKLVGKAEKKEGLASYTFKRIVGSRTVQVVVKRSDPMRFDNIMLAMGPAETYPRTVVSGRLDYDYETGNYYTDGITFRYVENMEEVLSIALMPPEAPAEPETSPEKSSPEKPPEKSGAREIPVSTPARRRAPPAPRA